MPEANFSKVGHGPQMGQNEFALVFLWFLHVFLSCFIAHTESKWDMEVLACFRPGFGTPYVRKCEEKTALCKIIFCKFRSFYGLKEKVSSIHYTTEIT